MKNMIVILMLLASVSGAYASGHDEQSGKELVQAEIAASQGLSQEDQDLLAGVNTGRAKGVPGAKKARPKGVIKLDAGFQKMLVGNKFSSSQSTGRHEEVVSSATMNKSASKDTDDLDENVEVTWLPMPRAPKHDPRRDTEDLVRKATDGATKEWARGLTTEKQAAIRADIKKQQAQGRARSGSL